MNKLFWVFALLILGVPALRAQNIEEEIPSEIEHAGEEVQVDSTLLGRDIFSALPERVVVRQSPAVRAALNKQVAANAGKQYNGFRIRPLADKGQGQVPVFRGQKTPRHPGGAELFLQQSQGVPEGRRRPQPDKKPCHGISPESSVLLFHYT